MSEEKKGGKGCLIALGVVGVFAAIVLAGVVFMVFKAKDFVVEFTQGVGLTEEVREQIRDLNERYAFTVPADSVLTEEQVQKFIQVKRTFAKQVRQRLEEFQTRLEQSKEDVRELDFKSYAEAFKVLGEIRQELLAALERFQMSPAEYRFLTQYIYQIHVADLTTGLAEWAKTSNMKLQDWEQVERAMQRIPQKNQALIQKYASELQDVYTYGFELWALPVSGSLE